MGVRVPSSTCSNENKLLYSLFKNCFPYYTHFYNINITFFFFYLFRLNYNCTKSQKLYKYHNTYKIFVIKNWGQEGQNINIFLDNKKFNVQTTNQTYEFIHNFPIVVSKNFFFNNLIPTNIYR